MWLQGLEFVGLERMAQTEVRQDGRHYNRWGAKRKGTKLFLDSIDSHRDAHLQCNNPC